MEIMNSKKEPSIVIVNETRSVYNGRDIRWHDKTLPGSMIKLKSKQGLLILNSCRVKSAIVDYYCDQKDRRYCGAQSIAICVNYLKLGSTVLLGTRYSEKHSESKQPIGNCMHDALEYDSIVDENDIRYHPHAKDCFRDIEKQGLTLEQLRKACLSLNLYTDVYYAGERPRTHISVNGLPFPVSAKDIGNKSMPSLKDAHDLRELILNVLNHNDECIIVNYDMGNLGYSGLNGHCSPIGAYDATLDLCLVLDVWPDTPAAWVKVEKLFAAMATKDSVSGLNRGCVHIQR